MTESKLDELIVETKKLNRLMSLSLTQALSSSERIVFLNQAGFTQKEIADTFGITRGHEGHKIMPTEIELLSDISQKLTELTAMIGLKSSDKAEQVKYLVGYGLSISTISRLTGEPEGTIGRIRSEIQKKKKK